MWYCMVPHIWNYENLLVAIAVGLHVTARALQSPHAKVGEIAALWHLWLVSPNKHPQTQNKRITIA